MRLDVSKGERVEQTAFDLTVALFAHMQLRLLTPGFCSDRCWFSPLR
jgi:hypothetical protein